MKYKDDEAKAVLARTQLSSKSDPKESQKAFNELKKSIQGTEQSLEIYVCKNQFLNLFTWRIARRYDDHLPCSLTFSRIIGCIQRSLVTIFDYIAFPHRQQCMPIHAQPYCLVRKLIHWLWCHIRHNLQGHYPESDVIPEQAGFSDSSLTVGGWFYI